jgi:hypothetical protein
MGFCEIVTERALEFAFTRSAKDSRVARRFDPGFLAIVSA